MRVSIIQFTQVTFGEILKNPKPPGYDILKNKFNKQLQELEQFFKYESKRKNLNHVESKDELILILDKFTNNKSQLLNKNFNNTQKKILLQAYAKAGKKINIHNKKKNEEQKQEIYDDNGSNLGDRMKLVLLMKRNWPLLEFVAKENGIEVRGNTAEEENWGFSDELEENEREDNKNLNNNKFNTARQSIRKEITESSDFNSFLRKLNKVHKTPGMHVLPTMTSFEAHPTISTIEIKDSEVKEFQKFLNIEKNKSKTRDELLFKAMNNYEWSSNLLSNQPRTLENKTFFTPVCVPGTNIIIQEFNLQLINDKQNLLKQQMHKVSIDKFDVMKIYADGSSGVLNNNNKAYWSGNIDNMYTLLNKLQHPTKFRKKLHKMIKTGWIPVSCEEREIVMVRNHNDFITSVIKNSSLFGILSVFIGLGVLSITGL